MKNLLLLFTIAVFSTGVLTAQTSRFEMVSGKEKKTEKASDNRAISVNPEISKEHANFVLQDGKYVRIPNNKPQRTTKIGDIKPSGFPERNFKPSLTVQKSSRSDVATITLKVIGDPNAQWGYVNLGYQMLLDANATMCDDLNLFFNYFWDNWYELYNMSEYTIPEGCTGDLNTDPMVLNSESTISIPGGTYDIAFLLPYKLGNRLFTTYVHVNGSYFESIFDDFVFLEGYDYLFQVEVPDAIDYYPEHDASLTQIILPSMSTDLTNQEEVSVVLRNSGPQAISGNVHFSFRVNGGVWTTPETFTVNLTSGAEIPYTYIAKADFSQGGFYTVEATVDYEMDMFSPNNLIVGYTKNPQPRDLPFYEDFAQFENLNANWTFEQVNWLNWSLINYDEWNLDADDGIGSIQVGCPSPWMPGDPDDGRLELYAITDPMIMPTAGTYNISFYAYPFGNEKITILYGTTSNYTEMEVLKEFEFNYFDTDFDWSIFIENFEIETPGNYYFAFLFNSWHAEGGAAVNIDNIKIASGVFVGVPDIMFKSGLAPVSACDMDNAGVMGAIVRNRGSEPIQQFTLTYQINNGTVVSQTFNQTIGIKESVTVYFTQTANFSNIGNYNVKFTASTPNEVNTNNNEIYIIVRHYAPVTEYPFVTDIFEDWNPETPNAWGESWAGCYYANWEYPGVPLLSRCFTFEQDFYRFTFQYTAGWYDWSDDFYVAYGKLGTDPYQWTPVKEFMNAHTGNGIIIDEEFMIFEITEPGDYVFAFFATRIEGDLAIFGVTIEVAPEYDFRIKTVDAGTFARLTPKYQLEGDKTFTAVLQNNGKTADVKGNIELLLNGNKVASQDFAFTQMGETKNVVINAVFEKVPTGSMTLQFNATIDGGISKDYQIIKAVSDSIFAWDNIDGGFIDGLGINGSPAALGLIFELGKPDILTSINVGLWNGTSYGLSYSDIGLAVYDVNDNLQLGKMYFEVVHPRTDGDDDKGITFEVPDTKLQPGKYYFEVRQLDGVNIGIAFDDDWEGYFYDNTDNTGVLYPVGGFGFVHIRPNFGADLSGIPSHKVSNSLTLYPNPVRGELKIDNGELIIEKVAVYNLAGQQIQTVTNINNTSLLLNTDNYSSGFYFITVQSKAGVANSKFVVY